jgi:hypothetical protein
MVIRSVLTEQLSPNTRGRALFMNRPPYHRALALKLTNVVRTWGLTRYGRICPYSMIGGSEAMMEPISIEEFVKLHVKSNPGEKPEDIRSKLQDAVRRKQAGVVCMICGQPM